MEGGSPSGKRGGANTLETRPRKIFGEHASRDPEIVAHKALNNEFIFDFIRNLPEEGAVRIFKKPEFWDTSKGLIKAASSRYPISLRPPPLSLDGAQWHLIKHTLDDLDTNPLGSNIQHELTGQVN